jgi:RNA polymerase sigma-70 factor, ECF subfamily
MTRRQDNPIDDILVQLERKYGTQLLAFIGRLGVPQDTRADVKQDVLLKAYKCLGAANVEPKKLKAWLFTIARHEAMNYHRRATLEARCLEGFAQSHEAGTDNDHVTEFERKTIQQELAALLASKTVLTPDLKAVLRWHFVRGLTFREIAQLMGISESKATRLRTKALDVLREALKEKGIDTMS